MHEIIKERLQLIVQHAVVIEERKKEVRVANKLKETKEGELLLDSLITRLQAFSENIKRIQKTDPAFFAVSIPVDVTPIIRFRDLASYHNELLNHTIIFNISKYEVPVLREAIQQYTHENRADQA